MASRYPIGQKTFSQSVPEEWQLFTTPSAFGFTVGRNNIPGTLMISWPPVKRGNFEISNPANYFFISSVWLTTLYHVKYEFRYQISVRKSCNTSSKIIFLYTIIQSTIIIETKYSMLHSYVVYKIFPKKKKSLYCIIFISYSGFVSLSAGVNNLLSLEFN